MSNKDFHKKFLIAYENYKDNKEMMNDDCFRYNYTNHNKMSKEYIKDNIGEYIDCADIKELQELYNKIKEKQEKTFQSDEELFSTNIGDFRAKYCYVNNKNIIFYDEDKKQIASIETSLITDLMNENGYIIDK